MSFNFFIRFSAFLTFFSFLQTFSSNACLLVEITDSDLLKVSHSMKTLQDDYENGEISFSPTELAALNGAKRLIKILGEKTELSVQKTCLAYNKIMGTDHNYNESDLQKIPTDIFAIRPSQEIVVQKRYITSTGHEATTIQWENGPIICLGFEENDFDYSDIQSQTVYFNNDEVPTNLQQQSNNSDSVLTTHTTSTGRPFQTIQWHNGPTICLGLEEAD